MSSFGVGESNKFFNIFTRELGLIQATAQSVRELKSKNRYGLQDFSFSNFSLVRGKDIWRITNVSSENNLFSDLKEDRGKLRFLGEVFSLIKQLIHGEEKNKKLFELISESFKFLRNNDFEQNELENFELITKMRILNNLGYFNSGDLSAQAGRELFSEFLDSDDLNKELILKLNLIRDKALDEINNALEETHL